MSAWGRTEQTWVLSCKRTGRRTSSRSTKTRLDLIKTSALISCLRVLQWDRGAEQHKCKQCGSVPWFCSGLHKIQVYAHRLKRGCCFYYHRTLGRTASYGLKFFPPEGLIMDGQQIFFSRVTLVPSCKPQECCCVYWCKSPCLLTSLFFWSSNRKSPNCPELLNPGWNNCTIKSICLHLYLGETPKQADAALFGALACFNRSVASITAVSSRENPCKCLLFPVLLGGSVSELTPIVSFAPKGMFGCVKVI